jgi:hypothetical protein
MTRILYIPTGEYIQFISPEVGYTEIFEESTDNLFKFTSNTPERYISKIIEHNYSSFLVRKVGYIKHIRSEFEIIYD